MHKKREHESGKKSDSGSSKENAGNGLSESNNPYLLQHASNPVNWRMWGETALSEARTTDRPLFISIGYSTCHWCHVMARESFEDGEVAEILNRAFIPIKVDREERPDIDAFYMDAALKMNGQGGWPLTIFAVPDGRPFLAATYIPKNGMRGRAGMVDILPEVEHLWELDRRRVMDSAASLSTALQSSAENNTHEGGKELPDLDSSTVMEHVRRAFDTESGGFGGSPKFPQPHLFRFILRNSDLGLEEAAESAGAGDGEETPGAAKEKNLAMVEYSLLHMRAGGIYDHVGLGFHRYATDVRWRVPHFEKMLYDQAMLASLYAEAYQAIGNPVFIRTARETADFVLQELRDSSGGFYSAVDAESDGEEGAYYVWTREEFLEAASGTDGGGEFADLFHVQGKGNWTDPVDGDRKRSNILFLDPSSISGEFDFSSWEQLRRMLYERRSRRNPPAVDDKILTSWNGLMIAALARLGRVPHFEGEAYTEAAVEAASFLLSTVKRYGDRLFHSYRGGKSSVEGMLEDYAYLTSGLLELYETTFETEYLKEAEALTVSALELFEDADWGADGGYRGGFFFSTEAGEGDGAAGAGLPWRSKLLYDAAIPSGSSVMVENLVLLFRLTGKVLYREHALRAVQAHRHEIERAPMGCSIIATSLRELGDEPERNAEIVLVGEAGEMLETVEKRYMPGVVLLWKKPGEEAALAEIAPYTAEHRASEETGASAYLCIGFTCKRPVHSTAELESLLDAQSNRAARE